MGAFRLMGRFTFTLGNKLLENLKVPNTMNTADLLPDRTPGTHGPAQAFEIVKLTYLPPLYLADNVDHSGRWTNPL